MNTEAQFQEGDALLIVDVQVDFCPGGALPIQEGDQVVPILNAWIEAARDHQVPVYASRDWHPHAHVSFKAQGGKWPPHCIQDSEGARFHADLKLPADAIVVTKGVRLDHDQNSAFDQTGLAVYLERHGIKRLFIGGLALDVCVLASVLDACRAGFEVSLIADATRAVDSSKASEVMEQMRQAGAQVLT